MQVPSLYRRSKIRTYGGAAHRSGGFTAVELMVVVALIGLLTALAGPSFMPMIERWRVRDTAESLTATLYLARSEAIKRGGNVTINMNPTTCANATSTVGWGCGWTVSHTANAITTEIQASTQPNRVDVGLTNPAGVAIVGPLALDRWGILTSGGASTNLTFTITPGGKSNADISAARLCAGSGGRIVRKKGTETC